MFSIASCLQQVAKFGHVFRLNHDVQVFVKASLFTEQGIDTPTPVDPDVDIFVPEPVK
jgi:hypothetical protein